MMTIHIQITFYSQIQIKESVFGKACQHMIEKSDTGIDLCISLSIQIKFQNNICLAGFSCEF